MLQGILGIASVLGGLGNRNAGRGLANKGMGRMDDAYAQAMQNYRDRSMFYKNYLASGGYNPQKAYDFATNSANHQLKLDSNNYAAKMAAGGGLQGDSNFTQANRHISENSKLGLSKLLLDIGNQYHQQQSQDLGQVEDAGRYLSSIANQQGQNYYGYGQNQMANSGLGSSLASLAGIAKNKGFDFLKF